MNNRTQAIALVLLAALASVTCSKRVDPPPKETLHPLEITDLFNLKNSQPLPGKYVPDRRPFTEQEAITFFRKLAFGNTCKWGAVEKLEGGDEKCPWTRKTCDFPERFSLGGVPAGVTLSFWHGYCNKSRTLTEVIIEVDESSMDGLIESLKGHTAMDYFRVTHTIRDKGKWMEHNWSVARPGLPRYIFRAKKSRPYEVHATETYKYPARFRRGPLI